MTSTETMRRGKKGWTVGQTFESLGAALLMLVAMFFGYILLFNPSYQVTITEDFAQKFLNEHLPFTSPPNHKVIVTVNEGATLNFLPEGRVGVSGTMVIKPTFTKTSYADAKLNGTARLEYSGGSFYLRDLKFEELKYDIHWSERAKVVGKVIENLGKKVAGKLELTDGEAGTLFNSQDVRTYAENWMTKKLTTVPVYTLKGTKWWHGIVKHSVEKIEFADKTATAHISLRQGLLWIVGVTLLVAFVLLIMFGMARAGVVL